MSQGLVTALCENLPLPLCLVHVSRTGYCTMWELTFTFVSCTCLKDWLLHYVRTYLHLCILYMSQGLNTALYENLPSLLCLVHVTRTEYCAVWELAFTFVSCTCHKDWILRGMRTCLYFCVLYMSQGLNTALYENLPLLLCLVDATPGEHRDAGCGEWVARGWVECPRTSRSGPGSGGHEELRRTTQAVSSYAIVNEVIYFAQ